MTVSNVVFEGPLWPVGSTIFGVVVFVVVVAVFGRVTYKMLN